MTSSCCGADQQVGWAGEAGLRSGDRVGLRREGGWAGASRARAAPCTRPARIKTEAGPGVPGRPGRDCEAGWARAMKAGLDARGRGGVLGARAGWGGCGCWTVVWGRRKEADEGVGSGCGLAWSRSRRTRKPARRRQRLRLGLHRETLMARTVEPAGPGHVTEQRCWRVVRSDRGAAVGLRGGFQACEAVFGVRRGVPVQQRRRLGRVDACPARRRHRARRFAASPRFCVVCVRVSE